MATKSVIRSNSKRKHYIVVYKGDNVIAQGYADDVAKELNITYSTLSYMMSPAYQRRVAMHKHRPSGYTTVVDLDEKPKRPTPQQVARYYLMHDVENTSDRFDLSPTTVIRYFKRVYGCSKQEWRRKQRDCENDGLESISWYQQVALFYLTHTLDVTSFNYNCDTNRIIAIFKSVYGCSKREYIKKQYAKQN